ncbi:hypothetical protein OJAV_G00102860 [Oryzias javanicus]|uniref:Uncharacterized protein n=1 Tax=Oryzias javanicus TaxID=123683 RepID=A0A3S2P5Y8_ORYJA|nr:hypothetical protein OJAV_G00102860 [Oryzias javanicus]
MIIQEPIRATIRAERRRTQNNRASRTIRSAVEAPTRTTENVSSLTPSNPKIQQQQRVTGIVGNPHHLTSLVTKEGFPAEPSAIHQSQQAPT